MQKAEVMYVGLLRYQSGEHQIIVNESPDLIRLAGCQHDLSLLCGPEALDADTRCLYTPAVYESYCSKVGYRISRNEFKDRVREFIQGLMQCGWKLVNTEEELSVSGYVCVVEGHEPHVCHKNQVLSGMRFVPIPFDFSTLFGIERLLNIPDDENKIPRCLGVIFLKGVGLNADSDTVHISEVLVEA